MLRSAVNRAERRASEIDTPAAAANIDSSALQQTPGFMIKLLQAQIFDEFYRFFQSVGFSPVEHSVMMTVRDNPGINQTAVAELLRVQLPNLLKILFRLERDGLIERARSLIDRRSIELSLTATGRKTATRLSRMADEFNQTTLAPLTAPERKAFLRFLNRLVHLP